MSDAAPLLVVEHLTTGFDVDGRFVPAVIDVSFAVSRGETLGLVGESGSGKSVTALLDHAAGAAARTDRRRAASSYKGRDLRGARPSARCRTSAAREIALIFQEPMTALNPVFTIGSQIEETLRVHGRATRADRARSGRSSCSTRSAFPEPQRRVREYPHQLSGGLRQRALIAMSLACNPSLVIADEPTTALDVTIQAQILDLLRELQQRMGLALLLITHDLGVVAEMADRVAVMYAGRIVEEAPVDALFADPKHPYTRGLMASIPGGAPGTRLRAIQGTVPPLGELPPGCSFAPRCPDRFEPCPTAHPGHGTVRVVRARVMRSGQVLSGHGPAVGAQACNRTASRRRTDPAMTVNRTSNSADDAARSPRPRQGLHPRARAVRRAARSCAPSTA